MEKNKEMLNDSDMMLALPDNPKRVFCFGGFPEASFFYLKDDFHRFEYDHMKESDPWLKDDSDAGKYSSSSYLESEEPDVVGFVSVGELVFDVAVVYDAERQGLIVRTDSYRYLRPDAYAELADIDQDPYYPWDEACDENAFCSFVLPGAEEKYASVLDMDYPSFRDLLAQHINKVISSSEHLSQYADRNCDFWVAQAYELNYLKNRPKDFEYNLSEFKIDSISEKDFDKLPDLIKNPDLGAFPVYLAKSSSPLSFASYYIDLTAAQDKEIGVFSETSYSFLGGRIHKTVRTKEFVSVDDLIRCGYKYAYDSFTMLARGKMLQAFDEAYKEKRHDLLKNDDFPGKYAHVR